MQDSALDQHYLQAYLTKLWQAESVDISALARLPMDATRETWLIKCRCNGMHRDWIAGEPKYFRSRTKWRRRGSTMRFMLRRSRLWSGTGQHSLRREYEICRCLQQSSIPMATVLVLEDDPSRLPDTRPFYLFRQVEGDWHEQAQLMTSVQLAEQRVETAREHLRKLALVHSCGWKALGLGRYLDVPDSDQSCARMAVEGAWAAFAEAGVTPPLALLAVRRWLLEQAPRAPHIALLKGANGYGEELFRDGCIVAMGSWEHASLGDPAYDLSRTQGFLGDIERGGKTVWGLDAALDYYRGLTGTRITRESVEYYRRLNHFNVRIAGLCAGIPERRAAVGQQQMLSAGSYFYDANIGE